MTRVQVVGDGLSGFATVLALQRLGVDVTLLLPNRRNKRLPPLVLDEISVQLLIDLFGDTGLFKGAHQLRNRVVSWGKLSARSICAPSLSISGNELWPNLLNILTLKVGKASLASSPTNSADMAASDAEWTVCSAPALVRGLGATRRYGRRVTLVGEVELAQKTDPTACWVEATPGGWLFLAPTSDRYGTLQANLPEMPKTPAEAFYAMLDRSCYLSKLARPLPGDLHVFQSAPALRSPTGKVGTLCVGRAAMSLDPLCGNGLAQSLCGGLLAASVIASATVGRPRMSLVRHFNQRFRISFAAHLNACARFYTEAIFDNSWSKETQEITSAAAEMVHYHNFQPDFRFQNLYLIPYETNDKRVF